MTDQQHPITPPPELVRQWYEAADNQLSPYYVHMAHQAARWGADQELEACCDSLKKLWVPSDWITGLRAKRRPKPPSKKQRGLTALKATNLKKDDPLLYQEILNAIEGLPND